MSSLVTLSEYGKEVLGNMEIHRPDPVLLIGDSGWGKTTLLKHYCATNNREFVGINFFPKMSVDQLVGMWRPIPVDGGVTIEWQAGLLSDAIENGKIFLGEELTRAPRDLAGRLLGVLDSANLYWSLPEAGIPNVDVHDDFWFIGSANPANGKYATTSLDSALARRFSYICDIKEPLADEEAIVDSLAHLKLLNHEGFTERMMNWLRDCRRSADSKVNTGDFVRVITGITNKGLELEESIKQTLGYKYSKGAVDTMVLNAQSHLGTYTIKRAEEDPAVAEIKAHVAHNEAIDKAQAEVEAEPSVNTDISAEIAKLLNKLDNMGG